MVGKLLWCEGNKTHFTPYRVSYKAYEIKQIAGLQPANNRWLKHFNNKSNATWENGIKKHKSLKKYTSNSDKTGILVLQSKSVHSDIDAFTLELKTIYLRIHVQAFLLVLHPIPIVQTPLKRYIKSRSSTSPRSKRVMATPLTCAAFRTDGAPPLFQDCVFCAFHLFHASESDLLMHVPAAVPSLPLH